MKKSEIYKEINIILEDWDPIGILQTFKPIDYKEDTKGEYHNYIDPILNVYLSNKSIYIFLIHLYTDLRDIPSEDAKEIIKHISGRISDFLDLNKMDI